MTRNHPLVSFVVPCYRLGHLVGDCVKSILAQSYTTIEVLVMDDCSPDQTRDVVAAIHDPRVVYVRNEQNLGHLRNYNKGIDAARGEYIWLISADDVLRSRDVLGRFVDVLERHPDVGYAFCPAIRFTSDGDTGVYGSHGSNDRIFPGHQFLRHWLVRGNSVPAAGALARKTYYRRVGGFTLNMPFAGDWYMWSIFALHGDVAYFADPMVGYRAHNANMTHDFKRRPKTLLADNLKVLWSMKRAADDRSAGLARVYRRALAVEYAYSIAPPREPFVPTLTLGDLDESLAEHKADYSESAYIHNAVYEALGDQAYDARDVSAARGCYRTALAYRRLSMRTLAKAVLAECGSTGQRLRDAVIMVKGGPSASFGSSTER